jgi:hypothetical protein
MSIDTSSISYLLTHRFPDFNFEKLGARNSKYLSYDSVSRKWKLEHFNFLQKIVRSIALFCNLGQYYKNTQLTHVLSYLQADPEYSKLPPPFVAKMRNLWQKTYPTSTCPLLDNSSIVEFLNDFSKYLPKLQEIIQMINSSHNNTRLDLVNALYVLAGIKPTAVFDRPRSHATIKSFQSLFPHLKLIHTPRQLLSTYTLINEAPLPSFNPRKFIKDSDFNFKDLGEAIVSSWLPTLTSLNDFIRRDQFLSYLLGYGPTWETFNCGNRMGYSSAWQASISENNKAQILSVSIFSEEHYLQLGKALHQKEKEKKSSQRSREELVTAGQDYHLDYRNHTRANSQSQEMKTIHTLYTYHVVSELAFQTDYIQKSMLFKKALLGLLRIEPCPQ